MVLSQSLSFTSLCYVILRMPINSIRGNVHYSVNEKKETSALLAGVTHRGYLLCLLLLLLLSHISRVRLCATP